MPPQRTRNGFDDSRSEASSTRDKQPAYAGILKGRRNVTGSNLKDVTNAAAQTTANGQQGDGTVEVRICCVANDQGIVLIATPLDQLVFFRHSCATCLPPRASSRHSTRLHFVVQRKDAYTARHWTAFTHNGTASCAPTYWQGSFGQGGKKELQRCYSP